MIREASLEDLDSLLALYLYLHENSIPPRSKQLSAVWKQIIADSNHHVIVNVVDGQLISSCICVIIPNLTRSLRPYALIENVVTQADHRGRGYASACLAYAKTLAETQNCYKMMLMTSSKKESTLAFYKKAGYRSTDKTAFVQWLTETHK